MEIWLLFPLLLVVTRHAAIQLLDLATWRTIRTVVVGDSPAAARAMAELNPEARFDYQIVGQVGTELMMHPQASGRNVLRRFRAQSLVLVLSSERAGHRVEAALPRERTPFAVTPEMRNCRCSRRSSPTSRSMDC